MAAPLTNADVKVKMISTGDGEIGASRLTGEVMSIMDRLPQMVNNMTGIDITQVRRLITYSSLVAMKKIRDNSY